MIEYIKLGVLVWILASVIAYTQVYKNTQSEIRSEVRNQNTCDEKCREILAQLEDFQLWLKMKELEKLKEANGS